MNKKFISKFFKYAFVGFTGLLVNLVFLYIFTSIIGFYYLISSIISFSIATFSNFIFDKVWAFNENFKGKFFLKGFKFFIVAIFSLGVNTLMIYIFTDFFGIYYLFSQVFAAGFTLIVNFVGNNFWTFRKT